MSSRTRMRVDPVENANDHWQKPAAPLPSGEATITQTHVPHGDSYSAAPSLGLMPMATDRASIICELMESAAGLVDDGYFKLMPGNDGKSWYLKYHWKAGSYEGHYVLAVGYRGDLIALLEILCQKVLEVRRGLRVPTVDRYYR